jgi:hypothetical protein
MLGKQAHPTTFAPHPISGLLMALGPFAIALFSLLAAPSFFGPPPPRLYGIPYGLVFTALAVSWSAIGGYIVATSRRPWVLPVALLVFTFPAILTIVLGPAIILILQNLGA